MISHLLVALEGRGGGYSLLWPIRGGSAQKGYLLQVSDIYGYGFHELRYIKGYGNQSFRHLKEP